ncbi:MAG: alkaline phosphatase [Planctomycetota bacterium]
MSRISRFQIASLKKLFAVALLCLMCLLLAKVDAAAAPAKNVILMISDGQGYNTVQATNYYTDVTPAYETFPAQYGMTTYMLLGDGTPWGYDPVEAWADFDYVKSNPTDSAAAATAIYTGQKTYSGSIGMDFDRESLVSIAQMASTYGKATGAVSSVQFTHATPAAVAAHNVSRNNYAEIANEMIYSSDLDVIMGGGHPEYDANGDARLPAGYSYSYVGGESTWLDLRAGTAGGANPWDLIESKSDFEDLADGTLVLDRVVGVPEVYRTLQYDRDWADPNDDGVYVDPFIATMPSLETMTKGALNVLSADPDGFFVMIEGGAVEWANPGNDLGRMI